VGRKAQPYTWRVTAVVDREAPERRPPGSFASIRGFRVFGFASGSDLIRRVDGTPATLMAVNAEKLARADPRLQELSQRAIAYADGYGAVLALRRRGVRTARIAGADLWLDLLRASAGRKRVYLVGSTDEVIHDVVTRLATDVPGLEIAGYRNGFLGDGDEARLVTDLQATRSAVVLVAAGSPYQELLMDRLAARWPALYMGLGGSFDVYTARRPRAPRLVQRIGLEWAHRFVTDPRRLPRLPAYMKFAWLLLLNRL